MRILKRSEPFSPPVVKISNFVSIDSSSFQQSAPQKSKEGIILFSKQAQLDLDNHIQWGKTTEKNYVEQLGLMIGQVFKDKDTGILVGVCEHLVPIDQVRGTSTYFEASEDVLFAAIEKARFIINKSGSDSRLIGWYHTHPMSLSVFMSGVDVRNQRTLFNNPWQFAVVLNPQKKEFKAYLGMDITEVNCVFPVEKGSVFYVEDRSSVNAEETGFLKQFFGIVTEDDDMEFENFGDNSDINKNTDDESDQKHLDANDVCPASCDIETLAKSIYQSFSFSNDIKHKKKTKNCCIKCDCSFPMIDNCVSFELLWIRSINLVGKEGSSIISVNRDDMCDMDTLTIHFITSPISDSELKAMLQGQADDHSSLIVFAENDNNMQQTRFAFKFRQNDYYGSLSMEE